MKHFLNKKIYQIARKIGIFLFDKELNHSLDSLNCILIINWHGKLGDAIISSFLFRELRKKANINISVVTTKELEPIYKYFNTDNIYIINKNHSLIDLNNIANQIKKIDVIIPLIGTLGFNDLYFIQKLKPLYVFSTDDALKLSNRIFLQEIEKKTVNEIYYKVLEYMKIEDIDDRYIIPCTNKKSDSIKYDILFNPFGSRIDKSLSMNKSISLLQKISKEYPDFKIIILSSPITVLIAKDITKKLNHKNIILAENIFSIKDSVEIIKKSNIIISVDTSIVHIAIGLEKEIISIYYQADDTFNVWLPKKESLTKVIFSLGKNNYPEKDMNNFSDDDVIELINFFWGKNNDK